MLIRRLLPVELSCYHESRRRIHRFDRFAATDDNQVPSLAYVGKDRGPGAIRVHGICARVIDWDKQTANAQSIGTRNGLLPVEGKSAGKGPWDKIPDALRLSCSRLQNIVPGMFTPVLAKHSKSFSLIDCVSVGVDRMHRNFEPMRKQVEAWQRSELTDVTAKVVIYEAFVEGTLEAPKHLARTVHDLYFEPKYEEFRSRTIWSLSNAFTSAFKELDPTPQFKATAKLASSWMPASRSPSSQAKRHRLDRRSLLLTFD